MNEKTKKPYRCPFEGCSSSFDRPYRVARHILVHNNTVSYQIIVLCIQCFSLMILKINMLYLFQKAFKCNECSKNYTSQCHLNRHINSAHKNLEPDVLYR